MQGITHRIALTLASSALILTSCAGPKAAVGIRKVDSLVTRVERMALECELAQEHAHQAMDALAEVVAPDFGGEPAEAFGKLAQTIEQSAKQADKLRTTVPPIIDGARVLFDQWEIDLEQFASPQMRQRSETRLTETQARYEAIIATVDPVIARYDALNLGLSDLALFLGNDLNPASVSAVNVEIDGLRKQLVNLDGKVDSCLAAARIYIRSAAPIGKVEVVSSSN